MKWLGLTVKTEYFCRVLTAVKVRYSIGRSGKNMGEPPKGVKGYKVRARSGDRKKD